MPIVRMYIEKFRAEVVIDDEHPLAIAQRALDAERAVVQQMLEAPAPKKRSGKRAQAPDPEASD